MSGITLAGVGYYWDDTNNDGIVSRNELDFARGPIFHYGFEPNVPAITISPNTFDPNLKAGTTDELVGGFDYEVLPGFQMGAAYTHRKYSGITVFRPCTVVAADGSTCLSYLTSGDFQLADNVTGTLYDGTAVSEPLYRLKPGVNIPAGTGELSRPGWSSTYDGIELTFQKRLSNRWMARGNFTWNGWKQHTAAGGCVDPTNALDGTFGTSCPKNGGDILVAPSGTGTGAFGNTFINARWSFNVSGLYELPWGFHVAASVYGREGYPYLQWIDANPGDGLGTRSVLVGTMGAYRYPNVFDADLRLEKSIQVSPVQINLSVDVFNVANSSTVLQRAGNVNSSSYNSITETMNPRIVRAGARLSF